MLSDNNIHTLLGYQFAPGEMVKVYLNGQMITQATADGGGNFGIGITTPSTSGDQTYTLTGQSSNLSATVTIHIAQ